MKTCLSELERRKEVRNKRMSSQQIYVSIELGEDSHKVGTLWFHQRGNRQSASFEYDDDCSGMLKNLPLTPHCN